MTVTIEDQVVESLDALRQQAKQRGISLSRYLKILGGNSDRICGPQRSPHDLTSAEFADWLKALSADIPDVPPLPTDFLALTFTMTTTDEIPARYRHFAQAL